MTNRVKPWTVRGSRYLIRERWLTARIDNCVTPAGVEVPYYV
jgi:8-oxo-dGDP phosphatase